MNVIKSDYPTKSDIAVVSLGGSANDLALPLVVTVITHVKINYSLNLVCLMHFDRSIARLRRWILDNGAATNSFTRSGSVRRLSSCRNSMEEQTWRLGCVEVDVYG